MAFCLAFLPVALAGSVVVQNGQLVASGLDVGQGALFVNATTGFVGIGISSGAGNASGAGGATGPTRPLHVTAAQDAVIRLQDSSGAGPAAYVEFYNDTSRWGYVGLGGHDDKMTIGTTAEKSLAFYTNGSQKVVLTASGNVGIGTASPGALVDVVNGFIRAQNGANIAPSSGMGVEILATGGTGYINSFNRSSSSYTPLVISGSTTSLMQGNVGIGTASTDRKVTIGGYGDAGAPTDAGSKAATLLVSSTAGGPGDGGSIEFGAGLGTYAQPYFASIKGYLTNGGNTVGDLVFYTRNAISDANLAERMRILSSGNVGIGTSNPADALEVNGRATASQFVTAHGSVSMDPGTVTMDYTVGNRQGTYLVQLAVWDAMNEVSRAYLVIAGPSNQVPTVTPLGSYVMSGTYGDVSVTAPAAQTIRLTWTRSAYSGRRVWAITNFY
jgi:hypothetical protein